MKKIILFTCLSVLFSFSKSDTAPSVSKFEGTWKLYDISKPTRIGKDLVTTHISELASELSGPKMSRATILACLNSFTVNFTGNNFKLSRDETNEYCKFIFKDTTATSVFTFTDKDITFVPNVSIGISSFLLLGKGGYSIEDEGSTLILNCSFKFSENVNDMKLFFKKQK